MSYEKFQEFHKKHPDLDNSEYYKEFPDSNESTVRYWKTKARKPEVKAEVEPTTSPIVPPPTQTSNNDKYAAIQKELITSLMTQTSSQATEFEGVDDGSVHLILKNRLRAQQEQKPPIRSSNSNILPNPKPIGQTNKKFGIDEFIVFDTNLNEIRMEIPMDTVMDPEKNKELRSQ